MLQYIDHTHPVAAVDSDVSISQVVADDPDSGTNGQVEYAIASHNSAFTVNPDTGEVSTILPLDYETQRTHDIIVEVHITECKTLNVQFPHCPPAGL